MINFQRQLRNLWQPNREIVLTKTAIRTGVVLLILLAAVSVLAKKGTESKDRACAGGARPRSVTAEGRFSGGAANIFGFIGPTNFREAATTASPYRTAGGACPGETASITVQAVTTLPTHHCYIFVGGSALTGGNIERTKSPKQATCTAVIK